MKIGGLVALEILNCILGILEEAQNRMAQDSIRLDIIGKIQQIANATGEPPGQKKFLTITGIKEHLWRGRYWRNWGEALTEAGFAPNDWSQRLDDDFLISKIIDLSRRLGRFPTKADIQLESSSNSDFPSVGAFQKRWGLTELAHAVEARADSTNDKAIGDLARSYVAGQPIRRSIDVEPVASPSLGYVYMQRHGNDYKIGFTKSLNKRGRQIQIELPQEIELVHSILTDDPAGVEAYWHRRFADKRTRGEWFKLTKTDVVAFKKWSKIW